VGITHHYTRLSLPIPGEDKGEKKHYRNNKPELTKDTEQVFLIRIVKPDIKIFCLIPVNGGLVQIMSNVRSTWLY